MAKPVEFSSTSAPNLYRIPNDGSKKSENRVSSVTTATINSSAKAYSPRDPNQGMSFKIQQEPLFSDESDTTDKKNQDDQAEKGSNRTVVSTRGSRPLNRKHSGTIGKANSLSSQRLYILNNSADKTQGDTNRATKKKQVSFEDKKPLPSPIATKPRSNTVVVQHAEPVVQTVSSTSENITLEACRSELDRMKRFIHLLEEMEPEDKFYKEAKNLLEFAQRPLSAMNATLREKYETLLKHEKSYELNTWRLEKASDDLCREIVGFYDQMFALKKVLKDKENQIIASGQEVDSQFYPALVLYLVKDLLIYNTLKDAKNVNFQDADFNLIARHFLNKFQLIDAYLNSIGIEANVDIQKDQKKVYVYAERSKRIAASDLLLQISCALSEDNLLLNPLRNLINERIQLKQNLFSETENARLLMVENWIKKIEERSEQLRAEETNPEEHPDFPSCQDCEAAALKEPEKEERADFFELLNAITEEFNKQIENETNAITQMITETITQTSQSSSNEPFYPPQDTNSRVRLRSRISIKNANTTDKKEKELVHQMSGEIKQDK